ncbi:hypothetical protein VPH35_100705 [Triticum aestivum]
MALPSHPSVKGGRPRPTTAFFLPPALAPQLKPNIHHRRRWFGSAAVVKHLLYRARRADLLRRCYSSSTRYPSSSPSYIFSFLFLSLMPPFPCSRTQRQQQHQRPTLAAPQTRDGAQAWCEWFLSSALSTQTLLCLCFTSRQVSL